MTTAQPDTLIRHIKKLAADPVRRHRTDRQLLDDFASRGDEHAFAGLVERHGPLVLRVCRRVLRHEQDAEDAFQATFLVLARHSGSIRRREALASWLYGVAYRTALRARRSAARRRNHETRLRERTPRPSLSPTWDDVQAVLDEEIGSLPESFRSAFVCCVLDGKTVPAAAAELGVNPGTLSWRLARARRQLRQRLTRRGIDLTALLAALAIADAAGRAAVPAALAQRTIRFGLWIAAGRPAAATIPIPVAALAAGVTRTMFLTKAKIVTVLVLVLGLFAAGAGALVHRGFAAPEADPPQTPVAQNGSKPAAGKPTATADADGKSIEVSGKVLDPTGKPVGGAKLYQTSRLEFIEHEQPPTPKLRATTDPQGQFHFTVSQTDLAQDPRAVPQLIAVAEGFGPDWVDLDKASSQQMTLRLTRDDRPITGRILDLEARPIRGATIRPMVLMTTPEEDLTPWFQAIKDKKRFPHRDMLKKQLIVLPQAIPGLPQTVTTDAWAESGCWPS
jgi:RNA polymerase sigma factor (sigma-70 family)